jgi:hypothetical protein
VAVAAALAVIAASVALATRSPHRHAAPASSTLEAPTSAAPTTSPNPPGPVTPTLTGARAAALAYLALSEQVVGMDVDTAVAAQRDAASNAAAPGLVADLRQRLAALHAAYPASVRYRVGPLAVQAVATGRERARVEIWYVGVLSAPGTTPFEQWHTSHYDLVWERGAWRVAAESADPGPRPASPLDPQPASSAALEAALAGFGSAVGP